MQEQAQGLKPPPRTHCLYRLGRLAILVAVRIYTEHVVAVHTISIAGGVDLRASFLQDEDGAYICHLVIQLSKLLSWLPLAPLTVSLQKKSCTLFGRCILRENDTVTVRFKI